MKTLLSCLVLSAALMACDETRVYEDHVNPPDAFWLADSLARFEFEIDNYQQEYNVLVNIRNGLQFPHANIYIKYALKDSLDAELVGELRNFDLFNTKSGYPVGQGSGDIYESQHVLLKNYAFPASGLYQIDLQQYMRYDSLPQIYSVGIRVEKAQPD